MKLSLYPYPRILPTSTDYQISIAGQSARVFHTTTGQFAHFGFEGPIELVITTQLPVKSAILRPVSRGIKAQVEANRLLIRLEHPGDFCLEVEGLPNLYLFLNDLKEQTPSPTKAGMHYFKAGQIYEVGQIDLKDGEEVYIEAGAWVSGAIHAHQARNIKISGRGVLDGAYFSSDINERRESIKLSQCQNAEISGITVVQSSFWTIYLFNCDHVHVQGVRELTYGLGTDGVDISSSRDVTLDGCFLVNGDDNIVIKAGNFSPRGCDGKQVPNVERIVVQNCSLLNVHCGRPLEIGHELLCHEVKNIIFRNIDIMGCHGGAAAFSISNSSYAVVHDILYENIRVEHYYIRLIDFRIISSRFGYTTKRGWIRDVTMKDIFVTQSTYNPGYSTSLIGGYDAEHTADNILFKNFRLGDKVLTHLDQLDLFTRNCSGIQCQA